MLGEKRRGQVIKELVEKMRGGTVEEIRAKEREISDRLFRLKFQFASGQTDALKKIRHLREDIARIRTILRQHELQAAVEKKS